MARPNAYPLYPAIGSILPLTASSGLFDGFPSLSWTTPNGISVPRSLATRIEPNDLADVARSATNGCPPQGIEIAIGFVPITGSIAPKGATSASEWQN